MGLIEVKLSGCNEPWETKKFEDGQRHKNMNSLGPGLRSQLNMTNVFLVNISDQNGTPQVPTNSDFCQKVKFLFELCKL